MILPVGVAGRAATLTVTLLAAVTVIGLAQAAVEVMVHLITSPLANRLLFIVDPDVLAPLFTDH